MNLLNTLFSWFYVTSLFVQFFKLIICFVKLCSKEFDLERSEDDPPEEESSDKLLGSKFPDDKSELNCEPESPAEDLAEEFSAEAPTLHQN